MSRNSRSNGAGRMILWALYLLDVILLIAAVHTNHLEIWLMTLTLSLGILSLYAAMDANPSLFSRKRTRQ
jgi:hypothetical protein